MNSPRLILSKTTAGMAGRAWSTDPLDVGKNCCAGNAVVKSLLDARGCELMLVRLARADAISVLIVFTRDALPDGKEPIVVNWAAGEGDTWYDGDETVTKPTDAELRWVVSSCLWCNAVVCSGCDDTNDRIGGNDATGDEDTGDDNKANDGKEGSVDDDDDVCTSQSECDTISWGW